MSVFELEHRMSSSELDQWAQYYEMEPFLSDKIEVLLATIAYLVATLGGCKGVKYSDFLLTKGAQKRDLQCEIKKYFGI